MKLTKAQKRALAITENSVELVIGDFYGDPVRWDVAERLVEKGLLRRTHTPLPFGFSWKYKLVDTK